MHLLMLFVAVFIACLLRIAVSRGAGNWQSDWQRSLFFLIFPPLLLLMTALAVLFMGSNGTMLGFEGSLVGYVFAAIFWLWAIYSFATLTYRGWIACRELEKYPEQIICGKTARIVDVELPYSAQIGFWEPKLVVSTGLLEILDAEHLEAVIAHEEAHKIERHTFWFFALGWLRSTTAWLPHTNALWQELLFWRELRADKRATQQVDPLVLAEALIAVAQSAVASSPNLDTSFSCSFASNCSKEVVRSDRLAARIDALLSPNELPTINHFSDWFSWGWVLLIFLPWMTIPLHY